MVYINCISVLKHEKMMKNIFNELKKMIYMVFIFSFNNLLIMKKLKSLNSFELGGSDDYANVLLSLKTLRTNERLDQNSQDTIDSEDKLNKIFVKTKKEKMRDIFIQKLKRNISTNKPHQLKKKSPIKGPCGILVQAIEFPERLSHAIILTNVIVVIILIVLATFEGFIDNFRQNKNYGAVLALKIICLVINVLYFILKCTNKSFGSGQNLTYIHQVLKAYAISGRLFLDFITILIQIMTLIFPDVMGISQGFFFFLIIVLVFTLADLMGIQAAYLHSQKSVLIWGLIKICLANIIFAHIIATIILAMARLNTQKNWMTKIEIVQQQWWVQYFYSFYWGTTIMMTVGFGDVLPNNAKQIIITSFIEMFSCILLGYNISEIGHLISQIRQKNQIIKKKLVIFERMVKESMARQKAKKQKTKDHSISSDDGKKLGISSTLEKNIINYIKQSNSGSGNIEYQQRDQLLAQLPEHLRKGFFKQANKGIFPSVLFFNRLKPSTVQQMADRFENKFYYPGQYLIGASQNIMILEFGEIGFGYKRRGSELNGQIFDTLRVSKDGQSQLLTSTFLSLYQTKNYELIAKDYSLVWKIDKQDLLQTLKQSSIDYQYYFSVQHKHTFDENQWCTTICPRCSSQNKNTPKFHVVFNCPRIVYLPLKQITILRFISISQSKSCPRRKQVRSRNPYSRVSTVTHKATFSKLLEKLNCVKKTTQFISQNSQIQMLKFYEQDSIMKSPKNKSLEEIDQYVLMEMIEKTIRKYDTGYEDGFWDLQIDIPHNYQFYFPNQNPNRLNKISVPDFGKNSARILQMKKYFKQFNTQQQSSFSIISS